MASRALHPDRCWFASNLEGIGHCEGRTDRCHLLRAQVIVRETCGPNASKRELHERIWDPRVLVPGCRRHHSMLDHSRQIRLRREQIPEPVEQFASEHGLEWWLAREYGELA